MDHRYDNENSYVQEWVNTSCIFYVDILNYFKSNHTNTGIEIAYKGKTYCTSNNSNCLLELFA